MYDRLNRADIASSLVPEPITRRGACQMYRVEDVTAPLLLARAAAITVYHGIAPLSDRNLHHLRIAGKDFRYTLELFEPALNADPSSLLGLFRQFQDTLGQIHDRIRARALLQSQNQRDPLPREFMTRLDEALLAQKQALEIEFQDIGQT